jgi:isochorismate synthase EntC
MSHLSSSNFLDEGALVSWQGLVYLFLGPFEALPDVKKHLADVGVQHFFDSFSAPLKAAEVHKFTPDQFVSFLAEAQLQNDTNPHFPPLEEPSFEDYEKTYNEHSDLMKKEGLQKTVPYVFAKFAGPLSKEHRKKALLNVINMKSPLIPFGFWNKKEGMIGVTPEILFEKRGDQMISMALAGTRRKSVPIEQLLSDTKLRQEHQIVVEELVEKWAQFGKVEKSETQILELPSLFHLHTPFRVQLKNQLSSLDLIRDLHPTSAVGVSPFKKWKLLQSLAGQKERGFYGSPLYFRLDKDHDLATVCLRLVQWDQNSTRFPVGGGIVDQSRLEDEWDEIQAKLESVKKLFGV